MTADMASAWFRAFEKRDLSTLRLAEDFVHSSPYGDIEGRQTYLNLVESNQDAFFSPVIEILDIIGGGNSWAVRYLVNGNPACDCIYVRDGEIARIHSYYHVGKKPSF